MNGWDGFQGTSRTFFSFIEFSLLSFLIVYNKILLHMIEILSYFINLTSLMLLIKWPINAANLGRHCRLSFILLNFAYYYFTPFIIKHNYYKLLIILKYSEIS